MSCLATFIVALNIYGGFMDFISEVKNEINLCYTENGDVAFKTSGSYCLDLFSVAGAIRGEYDADISMFMKAFLENRNLALKILFYTRDIRGGLGERNVFRRQIAFLGLCYPEICIKLIPYISEYGRYDDLLYLLETKCKKEVIKFISEKLNEDIENKILHKPISLLSKWLPSINTSDAQMRQYARIIARGLKMSYEKYRKTLSYLRKGTIIENNLREGKYDFNYENVPANAFNKYFKAFMKNDKERFLEYSDKLTQGKAKVNVNTLYPYNIIHSCLNLNCETLEEELVLREVLNKMWLALDRKNYMTKAIVVRDGSGSMYNNLYGSIAPIEVATSLAILMSEQLTGPFKNTFITFSENPQLVQITKDNIYDKVMQVLNYDEIANTNISKVYNLILRVAIKNHVSPEEMLDKVIIISDMEFDRGVSGVSTFSSFKEKFALAGYKMPEVIFWNVCSRNQTVPVAGNEANTKLVSGASNKIIDIVFNGKAITPYEFMIESLEKYDFIDELLD